MSLESAVPRVRAKRSRWALLLSALVTAALLTAACVTERITITAEPSTASVAPNQTQDITAIVIGTNDRQVVWGVCDGDGNNCVNGGNTTLGTISEIGRDSNGNSIGRYVAPASVPSPPACRTEAVGCSVVARALLESFNVACFARLTIGGAGACTVGVIERDSVDSSGAQATGGISEDAFISADGRFIAFASEATNLVSGDTNGVEDAFVRDTCRGAVGCTLSTTRVSVSTGGTQGNGPTVDVSISADGRFVAFESDASNLVSGDTNNVSDIFVRDRDTDADSIFDETGAVATFRVSVDSGGAQGTGPSFVPVVSATGRFVTFNSAAAFETFDTNFLTDVYVRDTCFGAPMGCTPLTTLVSETVGGGAAGNGPSQVPGDGLVISDNGRFITFQSLASDLVAGDGNFTSDVFLRDTCVGATMCTPSTTLVSRATGAGGVQGNGFSEEATMDATGRFITFGSFSTNMVAGAGTNSDIFLRDTCIGAMSCTPTTRLISVAVGGGVGNNTSFSGVLSRNGRFIAFDSLATNLDAATDTNNDFDVFVRDTCFGAITSCTPTTIRASMSTSGAVGDAESHDPSITTDGRFVAFQSISTNLISGDTNALEDVFLAQTCFQP